MTVTHFRDSIFIADSQGAKDWAANRTLLKDNSIILTVGKDCTYIGDYYYPMVSSHAKDQRQDLDGKHG